MRNMFESHLPNSKVVLVRIFIFNRIVIRIWIVNVKFGVNRISYTYVRREYLRDHHGRQEGVSSRRGRGTRPYNTYLRSGRYVVLPGMKCTRSCCCRPATRTAPASLKHNNNKLYESLLRRRSNFKNSHIALRKHSIVHRTYALSHNISLIHRFARGYFQVISERSK